MDDLSKIIVPKLDSRLRSHLSNINLASLSRISADRLAQTALPNIGLIEAVSDDAFASEYQALYERSFHGGERERSELIRTRLRDTLAGQRQGLVPYYTLGLRDHGGAAIGAAHFSMLRLRVGSSGHHAVPYLQYLYVRAASRRQDMSELLHVLVLAVAMADAAALCLSPGVAAAAAAAVPFTLFETEPPSHNAVSEERTRIHARGGAVAMVVRTADAARRVRSVHVQPGLEVGEPPVKLVWVLRPSPGSGVPVDDVLVQEFGAAVVAAYYQNLRDEGFPEENIVLGEEIVARRAEGCEYCVLPLAEVTSDMYQNID